MELISEGLERRTQFEMNIQKRGTASVMTQRKHISYSNIKHYNVCITMNDDTPYYK